MPENERNPSELPIIGTMSGKRPLVALMPGVDDRRGLGICRTEQARHTIYRVHTSMLYSFGGHLWQGMATKYTLATLSLSPLGRQGEAVEYRLPTKPPTLPRHQCIVAPWIATCAPHDDPEEEDAKSTGHQDIQKEELMGTA